MMLPLIAAAYLALGVLSDSTLDARTAELTQQLMPVYTWLHAHPEISQAERETSKLLSQRWRSIGAEVHEGFGGFGVVAILRNRQRPKGPWVMVRTDMDALPVQEETGLPYASVTPGVMHACGHDIHMTAAIGVAQLLRNDEKSWRGSVVFVGQPAEELGSGARALLADARFINLLQPLGPPVAVLAVHDDTEIPAGTVGLRSGPVTAHVSAVDIIVHGRGGHGAKPETTVDATVMAAEMVLSLQTIVSRRVPPSDPTVVTVGQFESGHKRNIISNKATLKLTLRSYTPPERQVIIPEIERIVAGIAAAYGAPTPPEVVASSEHVTSVVNDPALTQKVSRAVVAQWGAGRVLDVRPTLGGEDFAEFASYYACPALLLRIGGVRADAFAQRDTIALPSLHSETWAPDPSPTLQTAMGAMFLAVRVALTQL